MDDPPPGAAAAAGVRFLLAHQDDCGLWRDYRLEPGASEAWTTSVVGVALATAAPSPAAGSLERARHAVRARLGPRGCGYNAVTAADADSTAWVLRLLGPGAPIATLGSYLDAHGRAHTFANPERFGAWSGAHADVTPVVGLALLACGGPAWASKRIRAACLAAQRTDGGWDAYWWDHDGYAVARNLEFLAASGGVPTAVRAAARGWLAAAPAPASAFDAAAQLEVALSAGAPAADRARTLAMLQRDDGGWPPSPALLVPDQGGGGAGPRHPDVRGLVSTAAAVRALVAVGA